jgi:hypothetical protein
MLNELPTSPTALPWAPTAAPALAPSSEGTARAATSPYRGNDVDAIQLYRDMVAAAAVYAFAFDSRDVLYLLSPRTVRRGV